MPRHLSAGPALDLEPTTPPSSPPARSSRTRRGTHLPWYDRYTKAMAADWQEQTVVHDEKQRELVDPCDHDGPCTRTAAVYGRGVLCERFCRCRQDVHEKVHRLWVSF